jgi:hypothetical protein
MNKSGNNMCLAILVVLAIFLMYQLLCKNNKTVGGEKKDNNEVENEPNEQANVLESDTELESTTDLDFNDPDYRNYEPVMNNDEPVMVNQMQDNNVNKVEEKEKEASVEPNLNDSYNISGLENVDSYYMLDSAEVGVNADKKNNKLNPSELLPADSKDLEGNNFLTANLSKSEQIIGVPTQTQRSRKNYDLRSAPPNPQVEVSPWNMSTMEPDTGRLTFEIGQPDCVCE